jgi:2-hydroxy-6-oxonona-2,4-dienedioate hydrolase
MEEDFFPTFFQPLPNKEIVAYRKLINPSSKHTIIFLHGQATSSNIFEETFIFLKNQADFSLYAVDMRGFGESSLVTLCSSLKDLAEDVHLFIEALDLKNVSIAGVSTGGAVGLTFASMYPGLLKALILLGAVGARGLMYCNEEVDSSNIKTQKLITTYEEFTKGQWAALNDAFQNKDVTLCGDFFQKVCFNVGRPCPPEKIAKFLKGSFHQKASIYQISWFLQTFNISNEDNGVTKGTGEFSKIITPTLIIHGENDVLIPLKEAQCTFQLLGEKIARMEILPNCGHIPGYTECDKTADLMVKFIRGGHEYDL